MSNGVLHEVIGIVYRLYVGVKGVSEVGNIYCRGIVYFFMVKQVG